MSLRLRAFGENPKPALFLPLSISLGKGEGKGVLRLRRSLLLLPLVRRGLKIAHCILLFFPHAPPSARCCCCCGTAPSSPPSPRGKLVTVGGVWPRWTVRFRSDSTPRRAPPHIIPLPCDRSPLQIALCRGTRVPSLAYVFQDNASRRSRRRDGGAHGIAGLTGFLRQRFFVRDRHKHG